MATTTTTTVPIAFSPNVEFFAHASPDDRLKLWETNTGTLKQEYIPSSHLSATCSCLCWGPSGREVSRSRSKPTVRTLGLFLKKVVICLKNVPR